MDRFRPCDEERLERRVQALDRTASVSIDAEAWERVQPTPSYPGSRPTPPSTRSATVTRSPQSGFSPSPLRFAPATGPRFAGRRPCSRTVRA